MPKLSVLVPALLLVLANQAVADELVSIYVQIDVAELHERLRNKLENPNSAPYAEVRKKLLEKLQRALPAWDLKEWNADVDKAAPKLTIRLWHGSLTNHELAALNAELIVSPATEPLVGNLTLYETGSFEKVYQKYYEHELYDKMLDPLEAKFLKNLGEHLRKLQVVPVATGYKKFEVPKYAELPLKWNRFKDMVDSEFRLQLQDLQGREIKVFSRPWFQGAVAVPWEDLMKVVHYRVRINEQQYDDPEQVMTLQQYTKGQLFVEQFKPRMIIPPDVGIVPRGGQP